MEMPAVTAPPCHFRHVCCFVCAVLCVVWEQQVQGEVALVQGAYGKGAVLLLHAYRLCSGTVYGSWYFGFGSLVLSLSRALVALGQVSFLNPFWSSGSTCPCCSEPRRAHLGYLCAHAQHPLHGAHRMVRAGSDKGHKRCSKRAC